MVEFIRSIEKTAIDVCNNADLFLQSAMWGEFKSHFGWEAMAFNVDWEGFGSLPLLVLVRGLTRFFSFAYIPWGPQLPESFPSEKRQLALAEIAVKIRHYFPGNTVFIRFDPPWFLEGAQTAENIDPLRKAVADIQAPDTVIVDLNDDTDKILSRMKPKWRYNISLAVKRNVSAVQSDINGVDIFYKLLKETAARDGIAIHSVDYYRTLFEIFKAGVEASSAGSTINTGLKLYTASHEGDTLAAIIVLHYRDRATYLYGASSNIKRNLMAPYALQWRAMLDAKASGCTSYDLFGIPPNEDSAHPMAGLFRFKTGFGGKIYHRLGCWDYPYKPVLYSLFRAAESFRKKLRDSKKR